jgi:signal peptide peptidase SppA
VLSQKINMTQDISDPGGTSTEVLTKQIRAALADPAVTSIALNIDSPGGTVFGIPELAAEIARARGQKPVVAVVNPMAASGAYWLAAQAGEIVSTPSGTAGSIGVFMAHDDISAWQAQQGIKTTMIHAGKYKTEGNQFEPLTADAIVHFQGQVDELYSMFIKAISSGRGVTQKAAREDMGQGRMLLAGDAMKSGMIDRIGTLEETLVRMNGTGTARGAKAQTIREYEAHLRDEGWSKQDAKALASGGWKALEGPRDVEPEEAGSIVASEEVLAWFRSQRIIEEMKSWTQS